VAREGSFNNSPTSSAAAAGDPKPAGGDLLRSAMLRPRASSRALEEEGSSRTPEGRGSPAESGTPKARTFSSELPRLGGKRG
jgi:hypothetical protein